MGHGPRFHESPSAGSNASRRTKYFRVVLRQSVYILLRYCSPQCTKYSLSPHHLVVMTLFVGFHEAISSMTGIRLWPIAKTSEI